MSKNLYIATTEAKSGKSIISLGLMEILKGAVGRVAFFRPIINVNNRSEDRDPDIDLILFHFNLNINYSDMFAYTFSEARDLINGGRHDEMIEVILARYKSLEDKFDFVLIEGTDFTAVSSAFEFNINAEIANNLSAPILLVMNGKNKQVDEAVASLRLAIESFEESGCSILGCILNRIGPERLNESRAILEEQLKKDGRLVYVIPEVDTLGMLTMLEIKKALDAEVLFGKEFLDWHASHHIIAAMQLENFLSHITEGSLIITPGDRADIILGSLTAASSGVFPHIMGIVLTGGIQPAPVVMHLIRGMSSSIPIICAPTDTLRTVTRINMIDCKVMPSDKQKITTALAAFETHVRSTELRDRIIVTKSNVVTPKMFEYGIIQKAKSNKKHVVLPEGQEERILRAAEMLIRREIVDITVLGNAEEIRAKITRLGLKLPDLRIIDPVKSDLLDDFVQTYYEARKHRGMTLELSRDTMTDISYFGTMMVHRGKADGMVSGSINTTQHTVRPALEFVKTRPGVSLVSSVFFMCLEDRVLVYGDCAVNPNPNAKELAEIAVASARTAQQFGIEPRVAMLSYSTGESGKGEDVEKVREAVHLAREAAPDLQLEGPMQYDAAVDMEVARTKMPNSKVAGRANVFIFPDLNTGNNTYKAVQRSANAVAIGPVLQGLNKPVNDLSRGCTVPDIFNTVTITAIQAQEI